jgi:membrane fusion protein (multidrug efflux system)
MDQPDWAVQIAKRAQQRLKPSATAPTAQVETDCGRAGTINSAALVHTLVFAVDALPGRSYKGRVQAVDSQVDANGRALQVLAKVDNPGALLKPGMFARPRVVFSVRDGAVVVPEEALVPLGAKQFIFKVVDGPDGQKVSQRLEARIGLRLPGKVEILEGVQPGDLVATAGQTRLLRGESLPVRVIDISKPGVGKAGGSPGPAKAGAGAASAARPAQP